MHFCGIMPGSIWDDVTTVKPRYYWLFFYDTCMFKSTNVISLLRYESIMNIALLSAGCCWIYFFFLRITTNLGSIPSEECGWSISHWMMTWYFKERLHGIVCPSIVLVNHCCLEVIFFLLLCGQLKITIIISVHALRTYDAISNPISKLLTHGNLKQLSLGFTLYYYWLLHFSFTVLLHCWCARVLLTSDRRGIFFSSDRLKGCWKKNAWSQVRVLPFKQKMRKTVLVDYEQSLFFLSPSNKTREANWRKKRDGSQSTVLVTWFIFRNLVGQVVSLEQMIPLVM